MCCGLLKFLKFVALAAQRIQIIFRLIAQIYTLNLIWFHFDINNDKFRPSLANYFLSFRQKLQNAVFLWCLVILIVEVKLGFDLVSKCRSAKVELSCASTELKSLLRKLCCASEIKKKNKMLVLRCPFTG